MHIYDAALTQNAEIIRRGKALMEILAVKSDTYLGAHRAEYLEHIAVCESYLEELKGMAAK